MKQKREQKVSTATELDFLHGKKTEKTRRVYAFQQS